MKIHLLSFAVALAFIAPSAAEVASLPLGSEGSPAADSGYFQIVRPVAPHVWVLLQPKFQVQPDGNVTVVEQTDGLVLLDAGGSAGTVSLTHQGRDGAGQGAALMQRRSLPATLVRLRL
jgi:hypothetical protein